MGPTQPERAQPERAQRVCEVRSVLTRGFHGAGLTCVGELPAMDRKRMGMHGSNEWRVGGWWGSAGCNGLGQQRWVVLITAAGSVLLMVRGRERAGVATNDFDSSTSGQQVQLTGVRKHHGCCDQMPWVRNEHG